VIYCRYLANAYPGPSRQDWIDAAKSWADWIDEQVFLLVYADQEESLKNECDSMLPVREHLHGRNGSGTPV